MSMNTTIFSAWLQWLATRVGHPPLLADLHWCLWEWQAVQRPSGLYCDTGHAWQTRLWWWLWMMMMMNDNNDSDRKNGCMAKLIKHQNQQGHVIIIKFNYQPIDPRWMALSLKLDCIPAEVLSHDPGCAWPDLGDLFLGACIQYGLFGDSWLAATCRWPVELLPLEVVGSWKRSKSEDRSECIACRCTRSARKRPAAEVVLGSVLGWKNMLWWGGMVAHVHNTYTDGPWQKLGLYSCEYTRSNIHDHDLTGFNDF